jgi:hypothetical protein
LWLPGLVQFGLALGNAHQLLLLADLTVAKFGLKLARYFPPGGGASA